MKKSQIMTFGDLISDARKRKGINLTELSSLVYNPNGNPVSIQYLCDLEKNRRNPPSELILKQFASALNIPIEVLYFYSEKFPSGINKNVSQEQIVKAFTAFFEILGHKMK